MDKEIIDLDVKIPVSVYKRSEYWIAYSPALKVFGYSKQNADEALNDFDRALKTFIFVHSELNTFDNDLKNLDCLRKLK